MITLYKPTETDFTHNGEAVLDNITISAVILHKLNGEYSLEIELLKDDRGKYKLLRQHSIIKACGQLFRLYSQENIQDTEVRIKAVLYHITYDINLDIIEDYRAVDCKADFALRKVVLDSRFTVLDTDIETISTAYFVDELPFDGIQKKILERWGGELLQDNFNIGIKKSIGTVSPIAVTFRKNISGFTETRDYKGVYTRVKPIGKDGITIGDVNDGNDWLVSPRAGDYFKVLSSVIKFEDIESPLELKNKVLNELWGSIDIPVVSFTVDFIDLSHTVEYKRFTNLKGLNTGDTIKIYHEYFDVNLMAKVQETKRNAITGEVEELVLGDLVSNIIEGVQSAVEDYVEKKGNTILKQTKDMISLEVSDVREDVNQKYDELGNAIEETDRAIVTLSSALSVTAQEIRGEVSQLKEYTDGKIEENTSLVSQTASEIMSEVSSYVKALDGRIDSTNSSISQTANEIRQEVSKHVKTLDGKISSTNSSISQTASEIRSEISDEVSELDGKISSNTSLISQTASSIRSELSSSVSTLDGKINTANSMITQNTNSIATNITETDKVKDKVTGLETTVSTHTTQINQTSKKIELVAQNQENGILTGKTYTFDGNSFKIGGQSGASAEHTDTYSKWTHSDGSYTKIGTAGLERYSSNFNGGKPYQYYTYLGAINGVQSNTYVRCNFPEEFKGKDYVVSWWAGNAIPENNSDLMYVCNVEMYDESTKSQGYVTVLAKLMVRNPNGSESYPAYRGRLNVMYMGFL